MRAPRPLPALLFAAAALTGGCQNGEFLYGSLASDVQRLTGFGDEAPATPPELPAAAGEAPPIILGFEAIRVALPYAGDSGGSATYVSPDGIELAVRDGYVVRITGLGVEVPGTYMAADSPLYGELGAAAVRGETADRVVEYWKDRRKIRDKYRCTLSATARPGGGTVVDEACKRYFDPYGFTNRYWLTAQGEKECSRQWLNPDLAPLQIFATEQQALTLDLTKDGC